MPAFLTLELSVVAESHGGSGVDGNASSSILLRLWPAKPVPDPILNPDPKCNPDPRCLGLGEAPAVKVSSGLGF